MARITDENKLERLKQATMKYVVEKGYGGASAALIAKEAKIASGYFYLHYKGKYEMVNQLLHNAYQQVIDKLNELIDNGSSFNTIVTSLVTYFFKMAKEESVKLKFLYVLTNDYSFHIEDKLRNEIKQITNTIKKIGHNTKALDKNITNDDLYLILIINTIQYINQHFKNNLESATLSKAEEKHLTYLINKTLKQ